MTEETSFNGRESVTVVNGGVYNNGYTTDGIGHQSPDTTDSLSPIKINIDNEPPSQNTSNIVYDDMKYTPDVNPYGVTMTPDSNTSPVESNMTSSACFKNPCFSRVSKLISSAARFLSKHSTTIKRVIYAILVAGYAAYFAYALNYEFGSESSIRLLWVTMTCVFFFFISLVKSQWGVEIEEKVVQPVVGFIMKHWMIFKVGFILVVVALYIAFLVSVAIQDVTNLISFGGLCTFAFLMFLFSVHKSKIKWQTVLWGLGIQFVFALLVLRTTAGYDVFKWIGDRVQEFMAYTDAGAEFVFGPTYQDHFFAMKILPVVIFFSSTISVLYYLGVMQAVILKIAWVMQRTMSTTAAESVNAAGNIFIGQTEAPLLIKPFIDKMTKSELHAVMVGGYATIAGSVMATYILLGVPANHLISASIMAAPCALAISKLVYPETEESETTGDNVASMAGSTEHNVVEAASAGASAAVSLVGNIAANLIAFISLLAFVNATLSWFGHRVGMFEPELTFEFLCSYALWPFAFVMGIPSVDCRKVAELIGVKTFLNEFVAFSELAKLIENTDTFKEYQTTVANGNWTKVNEYDIYLNSTNVTLVGGVLQDRSIIISTYALCGFANISSIGCVIGALTAMVPHRQKDIAALAVRAMVAGNVVCFMNACTAGLLYQSPT